MDYLAPRIISFGCSFTKYIWPTYADILKAENKGWAGCGNERIFYQVLDQYKHDKFANHDLIIVQWSSAYRFDYLKEDGWTEADGPLRLSETNKHIWNAVKTWYNESYEEDKTENYKICVEQLLKNTSVPYYITDIDQLKNQYIGTYQFTSGRPWIHKRFTDKHPTISQHLQIATKIAEKFNLKIDSQVIDRCKELHTEIKKSQVFDLYHL